MALLSSTSTIWTDKGAAFTPWLVTHKLSVLATQQVLAQLPLEGGQVQFTYNQRQLIITLHDRVHELPTPWFGMYGRGVDCGGAAPASSPACVSRPAFLSDNTVSQLAEVGAATKFLKPLPLLPLPWLAETATATSATFSKSRNRYALLRYSATATSVYFWRTKRAFHPPLANSKTHKTLS